MQLGTGVAVHADHVGLAGVDVPLAALAEKLVSDPAPVASRTLVEQVGACAEVMAVDESPLDHIGPAHMAAPATDVTLAAMDFEALFDGGMHRFVSPAFHRHRKGCQCAVQGIGHRGGDFFMTFTTGAFRIAQ